MPYHYENPVEFESPLNGLYMPENLSDASVTISNLIARATTNWTLEESKLFFLAVSQIGNRDKGDWVRLNKREAIQALGINKSEISKLKTKAGKLLEKSYVFINDKKNNQQIGISLLDEIKNEKKYISFKFNETYVPLLTCDDHKSFTSFEIRNIAGFKHKGSLNLYLHLASWHNPCYYVNNCGISKFDIPKVFNLKKGQYWRNYGKENAFFDWYTFEKNCLIPSIEEINNDTNCDLEISSWKKIKDNINGKTVIGYSFKYSYRKKDGDLKIVKNS